MIPFWGLQNCFIRTSRLHPRFRNRLLPTTTIPWVNVESHQSRGKMRWSQRHARRRCHQVHAPSMSLKWDTMPHYCLGGVDTTILGAPCLREWTTTFEDPEDNLQMTAGTFIWLSRERKRKISWNFCSVWLPRTLLFQRWAWHVHSASQKSLSVWTFLGHFVACHFPENETYLVVTKNMLYILCR